MKKIGFCVLLCILCFNNIFARSANTRTTYSSTVINFGYGNYLSPDTKGKPVNAMTFGLQGLHIIGENPDSAFAIASNLDAALVSAGYFSFQTDTTFGVGARKTPNLWLFAGLGVYFGVDQSIKTNSICGVSTGGSVNLTAQYYFSKYVGINLTLQDKFGYAIETREGFMNRFEAKLGLAFRRAYETKILDPRK